jgi:hypothetical protein
MMKKLLSYLFKLKVKGEKANNIEINLNKFKEELHDRLSKVETRTFMYDYQQSLGQIYSMDKIDFHKALEKHKEEMDKVSEIQEKAKEAESLINSSFFNDYSLQILNNTSNKDLVDLACMSFVGSTGCSI